MRIPARRPEDWRRLLADPRRQWRVGYSAYELAHAWQGSQLPPRVATALATGPFGPLEPLLAFPEHKVTVPGRGGSSASDLFLLARTAREQLVAIAVEGKVNESFDKPVAEWLTDPAGDPDNRRARLTGLTELLHLSGDGLERVPYQLLHRTAAALTEARRFNASHAVLLIHSFSPKLAHHDEYQRFTRLFSATGDPGRVERAGEYDGVELHLSWITDECRSQEHAGDPASIFRDTLEWLRVTYRERRFFKERDVEAAVQQRMTELFEERRSDWRVYENHRVPGKQLDLAVVDRRRPSEVVLGIELKYEPGHSRAGRDMRGDTDRLPVCIWSEIERDHASLVECVRVGAIQSGYAVVLDEGGYWRQRRDPPPFGQWTLWGDDKDGRLAPAMLVSEARDAGS